MLIHRYYEGYLETGSVEQNINIIEFNRYYRFYDAWIKPEEIIDSIRDPTRLVMGAALSDLIFWFRFFSLKDLRLICRAHRLHPARLTKASLCHLMYTHVCSQSCSRLVYIYKVLPQPRQHVAKYFMDRDPRFQFSYGANEAVGLSNDVQTSDSVVEDGARVDVHQPDIDTCEDNSHLEPLSDSKKMDIIREWEYEMSADKLTPVVCAACAIRTTKTDSNWVSPQSVDLSLLRNMYLPEAVLPKTYNLSLYSNAILNPKGLEHRHQLGRVLLCTRCHRALSSSVVPKFALSNWLYYGYESLPSDVGKAFNESTIFDRMLVGRARANSITCRFNASSSEGETSDKESVLDHARKGVRGNILVSPLDVVRMNDVIPPPSTSIRDTMSAMFIGKTIPSRETVQRYPPVLVRKSRVKTMITFLLENNSHYRPSDTFRYSEDNLNSLFAQGEDEGLPNGVHIGFMHGNDAIDSAVSDYTQRNDVHSDGDEHFDEILMENVGYTTGDSTPEAYLTMKALALERCLQGKPFIASGTGSQIISEFDNPSILTWLFPHLDPWGIGGFYHPNRCVKIGLEEHLRHLLTVDDSPFERDPEFGFVFYNICRKALVSNIRFSASKLNHQKIIRELLSIDPEVLTRLNDEYKKNSHYKPVDGKERDASKILALLRLISKHVPGSDGYKMARRNEIRGLIRYRGAPTLFVTLNPSDVDHPIVRLLAGDETVAIDDIAEGVDMTKWKRSMLAAKNPSACARFFDIMISRFIRIILRYGRDTPGVYGKCVGYYGTVEAQGKGTLHCHMLIWLQGHLSPQALRDRMVDSEEYKKKVFTWLESIIKCEFPGVSGVEQQARDYPRRVLFKQTGDPHPGAVPLPSSLNKTPSAFWKEYEHFLQRIIFHYGWHEHQATCWKYLERGQEKNNDRCRMGMNGETRETSALDSETLAIILRRHHPNIAAHTDVVSFLMQCNMDIKFVGSGDAAKAFLYYVTDYITKASLPVHAGMAALSYAVKKIYSKLACDSRDISVDQASSAVITSVNSMMGRQEISQQQVMSYLVGGGDYYTSDKFAILQWTDIRKSFQSSQNDTLEEGLGRNEAGTDTSGAENSTVSLTLGYRSIGASSLQLDYEMRSSNPGFVELCLYDFVSVTSKVKKSNPETDYPGSFSSDQHPQFLTHYRSLQSSRRVPVILGPNIPDPTKSDEFREEWSRDMLVLFKPWRVESDLKEDGQTWTASFTAYEPSLSEFHKKIIANMQVLTECKEARDRHRENRHGNSGEDSIDDTPVDIIYQDASENVYRFDLEDTYDRDPFQEMDEGDDTHSFADILSDSTSRLLDMCLPVKMEDMLRPSRRDYISMPSLAGDSITDNNTIASHLASMVNKRKRKRPRQEDSVRHEESEGASRSQRHWTEDPIARVATLRDSVHGPGTRVSKELAVAAGIATEMKLTDNAEQLKAFELIADHVSRRATDEQLLMHIAGVGGTGKSHLIKCVVMLHERIGKRHELLLGAPTGIAAVLIRGQTLHSLIMASPNNTKTSNISSLVEIWRYVRILIVDEVSMVGARFLSDLSCKMRQGKGDDIKNREKPFGGVSVIFMGDFGQLKPPKQYALYSCELVKNPSFAEARNQNGISAMNGAFLWRQVSTVVELVKNERHSKDPLYAAFLSRLRAGECLKTSSGDTGISDLDYIMSRLMENQARNLTVLEEFRDAPIIVGTKALRDLLNVKLIRYHAKRLGAEPTVYFARDYVDKKLATGRLQRRLWGLSSAVNQEAFGRLPLFVGMKVMVTENLAFDHGIVNGSEGVVEDIKYDEDESGRRHVKVVYVNIPGSAMCLNGLGDDIVPIFPVVTRIVHKLNSRHLKSKSFSRRQVPLVPAYVYTDFKGQGRTLTRVIADVATAKGQGVYVMLSRVKSLSGLLILRWFPPTKIYHRLPEELRDELSRLRDLAANTTI